MTDDRFEDLMRDAKKTYRTPPDADFDAMWHSIEAAHFGGVSGTTHAPHTKRPGASRIPAMQWMGIAATLVVGIGLGRLSLRLDHATPSTTPATVAAQEKAVVHSDSGLARPYELETSQYLGQTAALLVSLPTAGSTADPQLTARAADLLTRTRLLMDSPFL